MWKNFSWIKFIDKVASVFIRFGGLSVVFVIISIFAYLLYEVLPIFSSSKLDLGTTYKNISNVENKKLFLKIDEQNHLYAFLNEDGSLNFYEIETGILAYTLKLPLSSKITSTYNLFYEGDNTFAVGTLNGEVLILGINYSLEYNQNLKKSVIPNLTFPYGNNPVKVSDDAITHISFSKEEDLLNLTSYTKERQLFLTSITREEDLFEDSFTYDVQTNKIKESINLEHILLSKNKIFFSYQKDFSILDFSETDFPIIQTLSFNDITTSLKFLLGSTSILRGDKKGNISQLFMVYENDKLVLKEIRKFQTKSSNPIIDIVAESRKKGFLSVSKSGIDMFYTTSQNYLLEKKFKYKPCLNAISPNSKLFLVYTCSNELKVFHMKNSYSDISFKALWTKVWYENYEEPSYIWQSSSAANDFEPKYSLMPLLFGTFKATLYAILFATPMAVFGAMYVGFFISPSMRKLVKPLIELMQAFPTVILGFLAGLYFAPIFEKIILNILLALFILPIGIILFSLAVHYMKTSWKKRFIHGFEFLWVLPILFVLVYFSHYLSNFLEISFFSGDFNLFLTDILGFDYDQRNALVVSFIMGLAVVPIIFSITEDAIFNVPKSLTYGSLALGANYWQTLVKVVFPTAAPSFFSAVMIGIGRAFGETMIILMATGNTPIMDMNIFEGMRTFSANLAVELPEAEVGSSHYRILFLTTLVLFIFSFIFNTIAEIISTKLRKKYSEL